MSIKLTPVAAAVALALGSASVSAFDFEDAFSLRGYGTLGAAYTSEDKADFVNNQFLQTEGAGYTDNFTMDLDSKVAMQLDMRFSEKWSAVLQVLSQNTYGNSWDGSSVTDEYKPSLEWANVSYRATDNLTFRAGRVVLPFLMLSDSQKVTYANHWLRAPIEVYGEIPFFTSDGGDMSYRSMFGDKINTFRAHYGVQKQIRELGNNDVRLYGFNDTFEVGSMAVRVGYLNVQFQSTSNELTDMFYGFANSVGAIPAPAAQAAAAAALRLQGIYDVGEKQDVDLINVGVSYDKGSWFVLSEVNRVMADGVQMGGWNGYASVGMRKGAFTPYATLSRARSDSRNERLIDTDALMAQLGGGGAGGPPAGGPPPGGAPGAAPGAAPSCDGPAGAFCINGLIQNFTAINGQTTAAVGLRWDVARNFSLKAQYDHVDLDSGSSGRLANIQPDFERGSKVNLFSLALDYVF